MSAARAFAAALLALLAGCPGLRTSSSAAHDASSQRPGAGSRDAPPEASGSAAVSLAPERAALLAAQAAVRAAEAVPGASCARWPLWERYAARFITSEGRVVDLTSDGRTTSEGQSYALFFALVAGDRARFERLLAWTADNLAGGDLAARLPAWHWGRRDDGAYGVIDANPASDADLWLSYTLLEAGQRFREPRLSALGRALAARIAAEEVHDTKHLGRVLLPGPRGFVDERGALRLNPSYLALPLLRGLATATDDERWNALADSSARVLVESAPRGLAPDWISYDARGFHDDPETGARGSYDAIRVYLWAALLPSDEPHRDALQQAFAGFSALLDRLGRVPERLDARSAQVSPEDGPPGFWAVALAFARTRGERALAELLRARLADSERGGFYGDPPAYYDQNLALFALGALEGRYAFGNAGRLLLPQSEEVCDLQ